MAEAFCGRLDRLVDVTDPVCRSQRRTTRGYEATDTVGSFCLLGDEDGSRVAAARRRAGGRGGGGGWRAAYAGHPFAATVRSTVARRLAAERRARASSRINTVSEYVDCLLDESRGPRVARRVFGGDGGGGDGGRRSSDVAGAAAAAATAATSTTTTTVTEHRGMKLFRTAIRAARALLQRDERRLEPFQWQYLQCFFLNMFKTLVGSDANRFLHEALTLLSLGSAAVASYDPAFPCETVASEMSGIVRRYGKRIVVLVAPRRSGKSLAVDLAAALWAAFAAKNCNLLLAAHVLKAAVLHLEPVRQHLETLKDLGFLPRSAKISKNDREVTLTVPEERRKSTFHVLSGAPNVSIGRGSVERSRDW